ncbi:MAG: ABC transporter ATP-binding protein [Bacteroidetes bacterium]|nr:MAG: ABC transporter ATP-binding protein [Bacteroidota bacterium]
MTTHAIAVDRLVKEYPRKGEAPFRAVDGISFTVETGTIFGLLGPNGAGKSTTIKVLTTLIPPTAGSARVNGFDVATQGAGVRNSICVVIQENAVDTYLTVRNNFLTFGRFHGLTRKETELRSARVIELFGLTEALHQRAMDLSGGMKRRLQVAKMFFIDKPVVFLDEATTGMDTFNKRATVAAIKEEAQRGRTIVLTTHMLDEAEELCDTIAIINHGTIAARGTTDDVKRMGLELFYLTLKAKEISQELKEAAAALQPVKMEVKKNDIELTVRDQHAALALLTRLQAEGRLVGFEMSSATLEDVFVSLLDKPGGARP